MLNLIGLIGTILLVFSSIPQAFHTWSTKDISGLSLMTLLLWFIGVVFMGIYVLLTTAQLPLLLNYVLNTLVVGINLVFYYKYRK